MSREFVCDRPTW
ncbi:hypothetical protein D021_3923A, partial [Vibrio parahaemolyticus 10296]